MLVSRQAAACGFRADSEGPRVAHAPVWPWPRAAPGAWGRWSRCARPLGSPRGESRTRCAPWTPSTWTRRPHHILTRSEAVILPMAVKAYFSTKK